MTPIHRRAHPAADRCGRRHRRARPRPRPGRPRLWRRGRRTTWVARGAAAGLAALVLVLVGGRAGRGDRAAPTTVPVGREPARPTPSVVSDMFAGALPGGGRPGLRRWSADRGVPARGATSSSSSGGEPRRACTGPRTATNRRAWLSLDAGRLPSWHPTVSTVLTSDGVLVLTDGDRGRTGGHSTSRHVAGGRTGVHDVWSPDSRHVAAGHRPGSAPSLDRYADVVLAATAGDQTAWCPPAGATTSTLLGVRSPSAGARRSTSSPAASPSRGGRRSAPSRGCRGRSRTRLATGLRATGRVRVSSTALRLLLATGAAPQRARRHRDRGSGCPSPVRNGVDGSCAWDSCDPVWQAGQPLVADGGLRRPATGESVMALLGPRRRPAA